MSHIEVTDVSLAYDTPAGRVQGVKGASFAIEQSEFLCLVGPSGCGKSTLLNIIAGFLAAVPVAHGARKRRVRARDEGRRQAGARADRAQAAAAGQAREVRPGLSASPLRRHAAARRDRARARL